METKAEFLRFASPNEMRTVAREDAGYYHAVVIGGVYQFSQGFNIKSPSSYYHSLKRCIEQHAFFGVSVGDRHTDKAFYQRVSQINLDQHISIVESDSVAAGQQSSLEAIGQLIKEELDVPCFTGIPPWRILVMPLGASEAFIAFSFSHMIGDGATGLIFHKTFLAACRELSADVDSIPASSALVAPPPLPLPEPFDTAERLPISWSYLLSPFISLFIPHFIVKALGMRDGASFLDQGTFTGAPAFYTPELGRNKLVIREIQGPIVQRAIRLAREHDAKLTGVLQEHIVRAMSEAIPNAKYTNFVSQTAVDMRRSVGVAADVTGEFVSGTYVMYPRSSDTIATGKPLSEKEWASASAATREFARASSTLQDQAIGLLRYLPSIRKWTLSKLGKARDSSFGVSNLGSFDPDGGVREGGDRSEDDKEARAKITKMIFTQPGYPTSSPITFNVVSVKGGSLVYTVTWQPGALGITEDEDEVVQGICARVDQGFLELS